MRSMTRMLALVSLVSGLVAAPVLAAPHEAATKPSGVTAHGPKTTTAKASAPKGQASTAKGAPTKSTHASSPKKGGSTSGTTTHASASSGKSAKTGKTTPSGTTSTASTGSGTSTSPDKKSIETPGSGTPTPTWTPDNPVAQKLSTKTSLLTKVRSSLPPGTDLNAATAGFKNFGQFVAAVNVSNNLGIPFADLKASMTGLNMDGTSTGKPTASLGQSIQQLKPTVNAEMEAQKAEMEATSQIDKSPTTSTTGTTTSKKKSTKRPGTSSGGDF